MRIRDRRDGRSRRGSALVASLIVVMIVAMMGAGLIQVQASMTRRQLQSIDNTRALYQAEAALAEAFLSVAQGRTGAIGSPDEPAEFDGGVYWVEAEEDAEGRVTLMATGLAGSGRFALTVVLQRSVNMIGRNGMFARNDVTVGAGSVIDGYKSAEGDFASQVDPANPHGSTGVGGLVASDRDVILSGAGGGLPSGEEGKLESGGEPTPVGSGDTVIYGDVRPGPSGVAQIGSGVSVTGATTPAGSSAQLPPIEIPRMPTAEDVGVANILTTKYEDRSDPYVMGPGERFYGDVAVPSGGSQTLVGPLVIVLDNLAVQDGGTLTFDATNGPITMYVTGSMKFMDGATVTSTVEDATRVSIMFDDLPETRENMPIELASSGTFFGMLYAPDNTLRITDDFRLVGAASAKDLIIDPNARVSFDQTLKDTGAGMDNLPQLISWQVTELPNEPLVKSKLDPYITMNILGITPQPSSVSYKDKIFDLKYVANDGDPATFSGDSTTFDWTLVRRVMSVQWTSADSGLKLEESQPPMLYDADNFLGI